MAPLLVPRQLNQVGWAKATGQRTRPHAVLTECRHTRSAAGLVRSAAMARRSLRPHLNQIRGWVRQGRTDAWIAHQLEAPVQQIETFQRANAPLPTRAQ